MLLHAPPMRSIVAMVPRVRHTDPLEAFMSVETETVITGLRDLVAEEMHLLGQELEDSLDRGQFERLQRLRGVLDEASELLNSHRAVRRR